MTDQTGESWRRGAQSAQDSQKTPLPKRFFKDVTVGQHGSEWTVLLDGRTVKTPAKHLLKVPTEALANDLAAEWKSQGDFIDPLRMPMTRLVNSGLDGVTDRAAEVAEEIVKYAGGDLLLYRAERPVRLVEMQARHWDPVVAWAERTFGGRFIMAAGIMPVAQPPGAIEGIARSVASMPILRLTAAHVMTTLTGSALLALAHVHGELSVDESWTAAHVDEDFQSAQWGADHEAEARHASRFVEMRTASRLYKLSAV